MGLAEAFQDTLFVLFKPLGLVVFLADLHDLLFDDFVLVLAHLGPLLCDNLVTLLSSPLLNRFDLPMLLLELLQVSRFLLSLSSGELLTLFLDGNSLLLAKEAQFLLRSDWLIHS